MGCQSGFQYIMEEESEMPVFTFIQKGDCLGTNFENSSENGIIYLTIDDENEIENQDVDSTSYLVQNNSMIDASMVLNSDIKIVTLGNQQYFYIPTDKGDDEDENVQSIEPHLISSEITSEITIKEEDKNTVEDAFEDDLDQNTEVTGTNDTVVKVLEPYEMILVNDMEDNELAAEARKKFKCLYKGCEKFYSSSQHLTVHMRNHMNSKPFPCMYDGCGKKFATNYSLTAHWRTHTGEKPYACQVCSKSFKTSGDLMKHVRIHTGEKPFVCPVEGCGKSFTTSNIRKVHVRSHTGERPYVCDYPNCGKAFASSTNYKNHARIHSGEKPYVCSVEGCDKKFTEYSSLYKHQAVHQVEKPLECDYCRHKFKSEHTLHVHQKVKHGVLVSPDGIQLLDLESIGLAPSSS